MKIIGIYERHFYTVETEDGVYERAGPDEWIQFIEDDIREVEDPTSIEEEFQLHLNSDIHYTDEE